MAGEEFVGVVRISHVVAAHFVVLIHRPPSHPGAETPWHIYRPSSPQCTSPATPGLALRTASPLPCPLVRRNPHLQTYPVRAAADLRPGASGLTASACARPEATNAQSPQCIVAGVFSGRADQV